MRKSVIPQSTQDAKTPEADWLDLESQARAELTSEEAAYPFESALKADGGPGWKASEPGRQTIRLLFDTPVRVKRVHVAFREVDQDRTQEFLIQWSSDGGRAYREIVRQQYTFSPPGNTYESEDYEVDLAGLTELEITIVPNISGGSARASLAELRLA